MSELNQSIVDMLIHKAVTGESPSQLIKYLIACHLGRASADYMRETFNLDPDVITYVYAWIRGGITDSRLDEWLAPLMNETRDMWDYNKAS